MKQTLIILKIGYFFNGLYVTIICDSKYLKLLSQEAPSNSMCLPHKVKYEVEGNSIMSESGFMLQFTKIKEEEKEEKCVYLACSQRLNYPDI